MLLIACTRRHLRWTLFGHGFDSHRLHQMWIRRTPHDLLRGCVLRPDHAAPWAV